MMHWINQMMIHQTNQMVYMRPLKWCYAILWIESTTKWNKCINQWTVMIVFSSVRAAIKLHFTNV